MTARAARTRAVRLREELHARRRRPGPSSDATAGETARLAVARAADLLLEMALLELLVTPVDDAQPASAQPARQLTFVVRSLQSALIQDMEAGGNAHLSTLFSRLNREDFE